MDTTHMDTLKSKTAEIFRQEPELLVAFVAETSKRQATSRITRSPADQISRSILRITGLYAQAVKEVRGGWTCGTYMNRVHAALSRRISSKYRETELLRFIDFCIRCAEGSDFLRNADGDIKAMAEDFLSMRPKPHVNPPAFRLQPLAEEHT